MRRLALLIAAGTLWLFLAAIPALADGGPHVASVNNGVSTLTADTCAECHRAHSAKGQYLLVQKDEESLCFSCHGSVGTGAATDVENGVQYVKASLTAGDKADGTILGYLRDGGFQKAHIGSNNGIRVTYWRSATDKSNRPKVPATATAGAVTSAHLDLDGLGGVTAKDTIWGNGVATNASPSAEMECGSCHNIHGNGQYRILQKFNASDQLVQQQTTTVSSVSDVTDRFLTVQPHDFVVGDLIQFGTTGLTGMAPSVTAGDVYIVTAVPNATQFQVAPAPTKKTSDLVAASASLDIVTGSAVASTVRRYASVVDDAPLPVAGDTRNYTILQVRAAQLANSATAGDYSKFLLYESSVLKARGVLPGGSFSAGDYSYSGGDYFHRTIPWNPALYGTGTSLCNSKYPLTAGDGDCSTMNDAPNGRPATVTSSGKQQITFSEQMSAWCATCHTRYWGGSNPPPTDTSAPSSEQVQMSLVSTTSGDSATLANSVKATGTNADGSAFSGYSVGDRVKFSATAGDSLPSNITAGTQYFVVKTSGTLFAVSTSFDGGVVSTDGQATGTSPGVLRTASVSASPWWYPRPGETDTSSYKYQHSTSSNRACIVCHVGHGSNAIMNPGSYSNAMAYPNGQTGGSVAGTDGFNSRLLKVDNRGTCQMCHEPTGTVDVGTYAGANAGVAVGTAPKTVP